MTQSTRFDGNCNKCGKWGHKETDCWQNPKNQGAGGGANTNTITDGAQQQQQPQTPSQPSSPKKFDKDGNVITVIYTDEKQ